MRAPRSPLSHTPVHPARMSRRPLALAAATLGALVALAASAGPAAAFSPPGSTTTTPPAPPTTPVASPTTAAPTTAAAPPSTAAPTTAHGGAPPTGVPGVPTGGGAPSTTVPGAPPTPPPPPVDVGPAVAGVQADLDQLQAIAGYAQAQAAVPAAQAVQAAAAATLTAARRSQAVADRRLAHARDLLGGAHGEMAGLALAAYTGEAYAVPGAAQGVGADGTVAAPAATDPATAAEAKVLLGVVIDKVHHDLATAQRTERTVAAADAAATATTAADAHALDAAAADVASAQQGVTRAFTAATVTGAAAAQAAAAQLAAAHRPAPPSTAPGAVDTRGGPTILGPPVVSAPELAAWFATTGQTANASVPVAQLAQDYLSAGAQTGVRGDLAFTQSIIETGYFSFPAGGQLTGADNNFAGIGACDSCAHGWSFPDALTGVTAQEQLLEAYASPTPVATPLIGPVGVGGCCSTWASLAGTWASNRAYGLEILTLYQRILDWVIPQRLLAAGLPAPAGTVPAPPGTEPTGPSAPAATTTAAPPPSSPTASAAPAGPATTAVTAPAARSAPVAGR